MGGGGAGASAFLQEVTPPSRLARQSSAGSKVSCRAFKSVHAGGVVMRRVCFIMLFFDFCSCLSPVSEEPVTHNLTLLSRTCSPESASLADNMPLRLVRHNIRDNGRRRAWDGGTLRLFSLCLAADCRPGLLLPSRGNRRRYRVELSHQRVHGFLNFQPSVGGLGK